MKYWLQFFLSFGIICTTGISKGQDTIVLQNPSFEDRPGCGRAPKGWNSCDAIGETPPDVQPGCYGVTAKGVHGKTYLGMVVRDNNTWEAVSQALAKPLKKGSTYEFSMYLRSDRKLQSYNTVTFEPASYIFPAKVRIWGGNDSCDKQELLAETGEATKKWTKHTFGLKPKNNNYTHLIIEAYYLDDQKERYVGNVMLDNCSDIIEKTPAEY